MTTTTCELEDRGLDDEVRAVAQQLRDLKGEMIALQDRARAGEVDVVKDAVKTVAEVRTWLKIASEAEAKVAERRRNEEGGRGQYVVDLDGARASIRCRLDRLRRCRAG